MQKQVVYVGKNGIKVVVDKYSDPRNVRLFNEVLKNSK